MPANPTLKISPPGTFIEIDGDALFLGRDCHLAAFIPALLSKVVSNRHCVVRRQDDRWMIEDLGSTNGTWIRGTRLFGKVLLHTGDSFRLGRQGPVCECASGFGGQGPDATQPEGDLDIWVADVRVDRDAVAVVDGRDGSDERPYRAGSPPEMVFKDERTQREYRAKGYTIIIGRDPGAAQICLRGGDEKHVSGRHVEVSLRDGKAFVRDLGSRNGTRLNYQQLTDEQPLEVGDLLQLGSSDTTLTVVRLG